MDVVLQSVLPFAPWTDPKTRRLPGTLPLNKGDWLRVDEAYAEQMALRDRLIATRLSDVHAMLPQARDAADELYARVLPDLPELGFEVSDDNVLRPDGVIVPLDPTQPLVTLGRLVQEDLCLMQAGPEGEHVLTGAILCFPAGWTLAEKLGRPMTLIHDPVPSYDARVAPRVQRLLDAVRTENPLWRANAHHSAAPLFNPRTEAQHAGPMPAHLPFIRSERQCLIRLPGTQAVTFSIHTYLVRLRDLTPQQAEALVAHPIHTSA